MLPGIVQSHGGVEGPSEPSAFVLAGVVRLVLYNCFVVLRVHLHHLVVYAGARMAANCNPVTDIVFMHLLGGLGWENGEKWGINLNKSQNSRG